MTDTDEHQEKNNQTKILPKRQDGFSPKQGMRRKEKRREEKRRERKIVGGGERKKEKKKKRYEK